MTNEQREAIKTCEHYRDILYACNYEEGEERTGKAIDIVLSLIKEQEIYIKKSNDTTEEMNADIMVLIYKLKQKDKQIDLMANFIGQDMMCIRPEIECNKMTHDCKNCIKLYFAGLVEKE